MIPPSADHPASGHGHSRVGPPSLSPRYVLHPEERSRWAAHFGVQPDQIDRDYVTSHLLVALSSCSDAFIFYGGTALSRTVLPNLRLSEDIDLLSVGDRRDVAPLIDNAIKSYMEPIFGPILADRWLAKTRRDTSPCLLHIGDVNIKVQLIDGTFTAQWPIQNSVIEQRYRGVPSITLHTYTPRSFVGAKTAAWVERGRVTPRDLYDLWALARDGWIDAQSHTFFSNTVRLVVIRKNRHFLVNLHLKKIGLTHWRINASFKSHPVKPTKLLSTHGEKL